MAQKALFFPTNGTGDGASQYTDAELFAWLRRTFLRNVATEGVHAGSANELAVSGATSPLSVNTGAAIVDGIPYENTDAVSVTVPTPTVGTTGHRVVLRANWAAQTVRVALVSSTDGVAAIPAVTQTPGTTYEITLATLTITTLGAITVTDARSYLHYTTRVNTVMIDDDAVTLTKIPNRTRKVFVPCVAGWNVTGANFLRGTQKGIFMSDAIQSDCFGGYRLPVDLVSLTSIKAVIIADATGNGYIRNSVNYAGVGLDYATNAQIVGYTATALVINLITEVQALTAASWAAGDYLQLLFQRDAVNALDTLSAGMSCLGWVVEYIADL